MKSTQNTHTHTYITIFSNFRIIFRIMHLLLKWCIKWNERSERVSVSEVEKSYSVWILLWMCGLKIFRCYSVLNSVMFKIELKWNSIWLQIPQDRTIIRRVLRTVSLSLFVCMSTISGCGIFVAIALIVFNIWNNHRRWVDHVCALCQWLYNYTIGPFHDGDYDVDGILCDCVQSCCCCCFFLYSALTKTWMCVCVMLPFCSVIQQSHPVCNTIMLFGIIICLLSVILLGIDGRFVTPDTYPTVWLTKSL